MTEQTNIRLLALVGMPGAGKTEAVDYVASKGWPKVYFGGIVYNEMEQAGIEVTAESQQAFREQLRAQKGKDYIARRAIEEIRKLIAAGQHNIVLDGVYSWSEYKALKHEFHHEFEVIAIVAPKHIRHHRLANRPERPFTEDEATHRDFTEIENIEKGGPIAIADHYIVNAGSLDEFHRKIDDIMQRDTFAE
jgi:dephospho-CoA kinase